MIYRITPVPKPRQTRSDKWKQRPYVMNYRAFADQVKLFGMTVNPEGMMVIFYIPMPNSWSQKKKERMANEPHQQKPDIDNLLKALLDAIFSEDSHVHDIRAKKVWAREGAIEIIDTLE